MKKGIWRSRPVDYGIFVVKWVMLAVLIGSLGGAVGSLFAYSVQYASSFRTGFAWSLFLMPLAGLAIVGLYRVARQQENRGTNMVLDAVAAGRPMAPVTGPLVFVATVLTHGVGGSSGREGAALQIGGSLGTVFAKLFHLREQDRTVAVMCGMSGVFAALFGTPATAAIFYLEVVSVGVMSYAGLLPCVVSAFFGESVASLLGLSAEKYSIVGQTAFQLPSVGVILALGILCALLSVGFCKLLHETEHLLRRLFPNAFVRILAASFVYIGLTLLFQTKDYCGTSSNLIVRALAGETRYEAFFLKALLTAITLGGGFKGGEIIPTLCVGATFGCAFGKLVGFAPGLCAACAMMAMFCGVTNCPISALLLGLELCGTENMGFFAIVIAVSYVLSGYSSLYVSQRVLHSKTETELTAQGEEKTLDKSDGIVYNHSVGCADQCGSRKGRAKKREEKSV